MSLEKDTLEILKKHTKSMAIDLIDSCMSEALKRAAALSETKIDDMIVEALQEPLKAALKELVGRI